MERMPDLPIDIPAAAVLDHTLQAFRNRMIHQKPPSADDLEFLEKAIKLYGELCVKEHVS
jgi:hypothetical protein